MPIFLVRRLSDGQYYRGERRRYGRVQRTGWTADPAKAKHYWQREQVQRLFEDTQTAAPEYHIVEFELTEQGYTEPD
jgi:hypothetical protein